MERHAEARQSQLAVETEFLEAEKVFIDIFGKVSSEELFAAVVEVGGRIAGGVGQGWTQLVG